MPAKNLDDWFPDPNAARTTIRHRVRNGRLLSCSATRLNLPSHQMAQRCNRPTSNTYSIRHPALQRITCSTSLFNLPFQNTSLRPPYVFVVRLQAAAGRFAVGHCHDSRASYLVPCSVACRDLTSVRSRLLHHSYDNASVSRRVLLDSERETEDICRPQWSVPIRCEVQQEVCLTRWMIHCAWLPMQLVETKIPSPGGSSGDKAWKWGTKRRLFLISFIR